MASRLITGYWEVASGRYAIQVSDGAGGSYQFQPGETVSFNGETFYTYKTGTDYGAPNGLGNWHYLFEGSGGTGTVHKSFATSPVPNTDFAITGDVPTYAPAGTYTAGIYISGGKSGIVISVREMFPGGGFKQLRSLQAGQTLTFNGETKTITGGIIDLGTNDYWPLDSVFSTAPVENVSSIIYISAGGGVPSKPEKPAVAKVEKAEGVAEITKPEGVAQVVKPEGVAKITKG